MAGVVHPVSGCSRYGDVSLVWGEVTLLPYPYLRVGVLLACSFSGVRGSSRLWARGRIIWPLDVPGTCCFLVSYLGFFPLASSVACSLAVVEVSPSLSSLRSFAVMGVNLILSQVLVGLPSWVAVPLASWDRSPISGPSVFFLSPRPLRCFPSFGWVCFWS